MRDPQVIYLRSLLAQAYRLLNEQPPIIESHEEYRQYQARLYSRKQGLLGEIALALPEVISPSMGDASLQPLLMESCL